ncbi:hypothetical protein MASRES_GEN13593_07320 [Acinetobacter baumannii]
MSFLFQSLKKLRLGYSYEKAAKATKNATELSKLMQKQYPTLQSVDSLELGAKVVKGEMQWP